jgi:glycosyltransferase involved in cell wall biosynthesis
MSPRVLSAILFSPRGGSAHTARALTQGLRARGWEVTLVAGSRSDLGPHGDARVFYGDPHAVAFDQALATDAPLSFEGGPGTAPLHPSYEDRPGAPDIVFAALDDLDYERQVRAWSRELERAGVRTADVLHLHHLTPLNEAAFRVAPGIPVVGQLHGSELLMLERIVAGAPSGWRRAEKWAERMRSWAQRCARLVVAPAGVDRALGLLDVPRDRVLALPNGVDTALFRTREVDRGALWRRVLVEWPRGWLPGEPPGSARYRDEQVEGVAGGTVLLYVGRFTAVKRLDRLIGAFAMAKQLLAPPSSLVLVGGHPGEWEGEHPADVAARLGVEDVFLAGWYKHEELPELFSGADAVVMASERDQFGQVLVEGMACELPAVAPRSLGPAMIIDDGETGWLTAPDDEDALARAMVELVTRPEDRARRGAAARVAVCERFSWKSISEEFAGALEAVLDYGASTRAASRGPSLAPARSNPPHR